MRKINFNSIKSRMIIGYGSMALLIVIVVIITLSQIGKIMMMGNDVLENKQPSRIYVNAFKSGIRHSNVNLQDYLLSGNDRLKNEIEEIWEKEIQSAKDSIDSLKSSWENPENIILYEKLSRLGNRIQLKQKEVMNNAQFGGGDIRLSINDYPGSESDTIYDSNDLQNWIDDELADQSSNNNPNGNLYADNLKSLSDEFDEKASLLYANIEEESWGVAEKIYNARDRFVIVESIIVIISILLCFILYRFARRQFKSSINTLQDEVKILSEGNIPETRANTNDEFDIILEEIHTLSENLSNVKNFALEVGKGSFDSDISVFNNQGDIGLSLAEMRDSLKNVSEEARIRNWTNKGSAEFGDILRKYNNNISELSDHVITFMVNYLNANQGSIFIVDEDENGEEALRLTATYAYDRKKFLEKTIQPGQGLVGQVYLEKQSIYMKELPENYITITSGLGKATPKSIFIVPLIANETVYGVIEIGTFTEFTDNERKFIEDVGENIASSVQSVKINERTNKLLEDSQQMTEEMRAQEEEMRQNMEELQATQEEMERAQKESNERLVAMEKSGMAYIEFNPKGDILTADETFIKLFGYNSVDEIKGRHHRIFVSEDYANSEDYQSFWENLRAGKIQSGIFERYSKNGQKINIKGSYSILRNQNEEITKIVKFAFDITEVYQKIDALVKEKDALIQQIEEIESKIKSTGEGGLAELKAYQQELKKSLIEKLQKNESELKASLEKQKRDLGIS
ncbi:GAF domain-containing protein [Marivirga salinae]|uniref:GAF domain-containing protein n=1 Tax=Marivirga salinarum TaxID=3059078 RepID=A0AA51NBR9_9BACT|nr:GAF domain-containing protein [Marivirga sp. BDSF4-3]WMN12442.1 GAF domain-containing protein [Marivirga sp. BDSF4-3]